MSDECHAESIEHFNRQVEASGIDVKWKSCIVKNPQNIKFTTICILK